MHNTFSSIYAKPDALFEVAFTLRYSLADHTPFLVYLTAYSEIFLYQPWGQDIDSNADAATTWYYNTDLYGTITHHITEHYTNLDDALARVRQLLNLPNSVPAVTLRRILSILYTSRIIPISYHIADLVDDRLVDHDGDILPDP
jgi:hypothetical protein